MWLVSVFHMVFKTNLILALWKIHLYSRYAKQDMTKFWRKSTALLIHEVLV